MNKGYLQRKEKNSNTQKKCCLSCGQLNFGNSKYCIGCLQNSEGDKMESIGRENMTTEVMTKVIKDKNKYTNLQKIIDLLKHKEKAHISEIANETGINKNSVMGCLNMSVINGEHFNRLGKGYYCLKKLNGE